MEAQVPSRRGNTTRLDHIDVYVLKLLTGKNFESAYFKEELCAEQFTCAPGAHSLHVLQVPQARASNRKQNQFHIEPVSNC